MTNSFKIVEGASVTLLYSHGEVPQAVIGVVGAADPFLFECGDSVCDEIRAGEIALFTVQEGDFVYRSERKIIKVMRWGSRWRVYTDSAAWERVDRRRHPRHTVNLIAEIRCITESGNEVQLQTVSGEVRDLSLGGAWMKSDARLPQGSIADVRLYFSPGTSARFLGVVAWNSDTTGFGVEFLDSIGDARNQLHSYLSQAA